MYISNRNKVNLEMVMREQKPDIQTICLGNLINLNESTK